MISHLIKKIQTSSLLHLKINSNINKTSKLSRGCKIKNSNIGFYSYVGPKSIINNSQIGNYCSISSNVKIGLGNHPTSYFSTSPLFYSKNNIFNNKSSVIFKYEHEFKQIIIGNDVWIGSNVLILDGVKVGNGAIIAAGSVVTKDVDPYSIVGGVPSKLIKKRFEPETIHEIELSQWWNFPPSKVISMDFINKFRDRI